jgi:hypothetical protein
VDERGRRLGRNEALFREVNEQIETLNQGLAAISDEKMHIVCECASLDCAEQLTVPIADYERIRADAELFFVARGHERLDVEVVVEENPAFTVVRKNKGAPAQIAHETYRRGE